MASISTFAAVVCSSLYGSALCNFLICQENLQTALNGFSATLSKITVKKMSLALLDRLKDLQTAKYIQKNFQRLKIICGIKTFWQGSTLVKFDNVGNSYLLSQKHE